MMVRAVLWPLFSRAGSLTRTALLLCCPLALLWQR